MYTSQNWGAGCDGWARVCDGVKTWPWGAVRDAEGSAFPFYFCEGNNKLPLIPVFVFLEMSRKLAGFLSPFEMSKTLVGWNSITVIIGL